MTLVDRIGQIAKERGLTFKSLEREVGLGNGTIKRWELQSPRLDRLVKVAEYLQVSLDDLVFGSSQTEPTETGGKSRRLDNLKREQGLICDGSPLKDEEADLIAMYRLLPSHEKEDLFDLAYFKYKKHVEKKEGSIYWTYFDESSDEKSGPAQGLKAQGGTA